MKKILGYLLLLSIFASCGGSGSKNSSEAKSSAKAAKGVIKAAALISKSEAADILGQSMEDREPSKSPFIDQSGYASNDFSFSISLWQEALHDKSSEFEKTLLKDGWSTYMKEMEKAFARDSNTSVMDGIDGIAHLQDGGAMGLWLLHIFYDDYFITISLMNTSFSRVDSDELISWKHAKLNEAGKLAVRKLKEILR